MSRNLPKNYKDDMETVDTLHKRFAETIQSVLIRHQLPNRYCLGKLLRIKHFDAV